MIHIFKMLLCVFIATLMNCCRAMENNKSDNNWHHQEKRKSQSKTVPNKKTKHNSSNLEKLNEQLLEVCTQDNPQLTIITDILRSGADPNCRNEYGFPALSFICLRPTILRIDLITTLVEKGAKLDCKDMHGNTSLHYACVNTKITLEVLKFLIEKGGADINCINKAGETPLHRACKERNLSLEILEFFLEKGAHFNEIILSKIIHVIQGALKFLKANKCNKSQIVKYIYYSSSQSLKNRIRTFILSLNRNSEHRASYSKSIQKNMSLKIIIEICKDQILTILALCLNKMSNEETSGQLSNLFDEIHTYH